MDIKELKVLLIEDNIADAKLLFHLLNDDHEFKWDILHVVNLKGAVKVLKEGQFDVIVLDLFLPDSQGIDSLARIQAQNAMIPIVVLTGLDDQDVATDAVKQGAQDFLIKDQITEDLFKKSIRYAIVRKNSDRVRNEFLGYVSHELNTPLTILREGISQVADGIFGEVNDKQKQYLGLALSNIDRLTYIVEDLLDVAKFEFGKIQLDENIFNIVELTKGIVESFRPGIEKKGLRISEEYSDEIILVNADRTRVSQVFNNLISNSLKFTQKGELNVALKKEGAMVRCCVSDTGMGIAKDDLSKVFDKFERLAKKGRFQEKGTGLGLSICKSIIELHNGKIWVESKLNEGTQFIFLLPVYGQEYSDHSSDSRNEFPSIG